MWTRTNKVLVFTVRKQLCAGNAGCLSASPLLTPSFTITPPLPTPSPKAQPVRGSSYRRHTCFSIMSSSACRKRKPLLQPETLERSTRDSSLSSALHFLNEIPLPLWAAEGGGGVRKEGGAQRQRRKKNIFFFLFFLLQSVRELKGGVLQSGYSEEVCLPFGHFVLELTMPTGEEAFLRGAFQCSGKLHNIQTEGILWIHNTWWLCLAKETTVESTFIKR